MKNTRTLQQINILQHDMVYHIQTLKNNLRQEKSLEWQNIDNLALALHTALNDLKEQIKSLELQH